MLLDTLEKEKSNNTIKGDLIKISIYYFNYGSFL